MTPSDQVNPSADENLCARSSKLHLIAWHLRTNTVYYNTYDDPHQRPMLNKSMASQLKWQGPNTNQLTRHIPAANMQNAHA